MMTEQDQRMWCERFSHGARYGLLLQDDQCNLAFDWAFSRGALDGSGRLARMLDVPYWCDESFHKTALQEPWPVAAPDAAAAKDVDLGMPCIEIEGEGFAAVKDNHSVKWQCSRSLQRLRGRIELGNLAEAPSLPFRRYLLGVNRDIRFARVVCLERRVVLEAVFPSVDSRWLALSQKALATVTKILQPQIAWWYQPRELVDAFLTQAQAFGPRI